MGFRPYAIVGVMSKVFEAEAEEAVVQQAASGLLLAPRCLNQAYLHPPTAVNRGRIVHTQRSTVGGSCAHTAVKHTAVNSCTHSGQQWGTPTGGEAVGGLHAHSPA